jgi:glutamate racemase
MKQNPIGVFDSGYGGLTVLKELISRLPQYDYLYLGDNARSPYGTRSYDTVYKYTWQSVQWFFNKGCNLVVLACNTASAKALRTIQQNDLVPGDATKRVLGVIRPTTEIIGTLSKTGHVGIFGTTGTVQSGSYPIEIHKFFPEVVVSQEACPMWVPLIENNEHEKPGADYYIRQHIEGLLRQDASIDTILLACTHYPLIINKLKSMLPTGIAVIPQGDIVAKSLETYLQNHPEMEAGISRTGRRDFYTTGDVGQFNACARDFYGEVIDARHADLV